MIFIYFISFFVLVSLTNVYIVWFFIEIIFIFFLLSVLTKDSKSYGLVIYYFFQRIISLFLFICIFFILDSIIFYIICAKLGLFPFFYWIIVVRVKIGFYGNYFVLALQKLPVFWIFWLINNYSTFLLLWICYLRVFFVLINLLLISDLWLLLIYSSIANSRLLLISVLGSHYFISIFLYIIIVLFIIYYIQTSDSYYDIMLVVFMFLVIPPFILFYIKYLLVFSLDFSLKLIFFIFVFDVLILFYYFTLIFIKFMLIEINLLVYYINLIILFVLLFLRNYVTLVIFYKS